ncbi:dCMP deaminase [Catenuloplanes sp. NPDC051500]|uniref:dCMP deaminase n=1 Tax=Catenuloplanes sp. NPDC051500 TaxID=3363959 RepID=UPI0037A7B556
MAERDRHWSRIAVELSRDCPPSATAYAVGAVIVDPAGRELARGRSRESGPHEHAEEVALSRLAPGTDLRGATLYSSLEPCSSRRSRPRTCTELVIAAGIRRVVMVLREPPVFVRCEGVALLRRAGVQVVELPELAEQVRSINAAVLRGQ